MTASFQTVPRTAGETIPYTFNAPDDVGLTGSPTLAIMMRNVDLHTDIFRSDGASPALTAPVYSNTTKKITGSIAETVTTNMAGKTYKVWIWRTDTGSKTVVIRGDVPFEDGPQP